MKQQINNIIVLSTLMIVLASVVSCATRPNPDPLTGWKVLLSHDSENLDQVVKDDFRGFIQKELVPKNYIIDDNNIWFYADDFGQHAIRIEVPRNGTYREYVLIYDKNSKRIKTLNYFGGRYSS